MTEESSPETWHLSDTEVFIKYGDAFVPRRYEQISAVCDLISGASIPHVLDLCCGEGRLSEEYLRRHSNARVTVLDGSSEMLSVTRTRLAPFNDRVDEVMADIEDRSWRTEVTYGGVMTSLAVHHLDGAGKQQLYRDVYNMLARGGVFVMADLIEPAGPRTRALAGAHWHEAVRRASEEHFGNDEAVKVFDETEWNHYTLEAPDPVDKPSSVVENLTWLREAGFAEVDIPWMYGGHAVFYARREAE